MKDCTELVARIRKGDREALCTVVSEIQDDIYHLLLGQLRNTADAEDAMQETFRQIVTSLHELREPRAFAGWVYRIALDKARHVRRAGASAEKTAREAARASHSRGGDEMHPVEEAELKVKVAEAVAGLDGEMQLAIRLRYEHDLSHAQIAEAMDLPESTVSRRLGAAHLRLREALAGAGVVIAMALLERELSAAERHPVPAQLGRVLERISREKKTGTRLKWSAPGARGRQTRTLLLGTMAILALLTPLGWWVMKGRNSSASRTPGMAAAERAARVAGKAPSEVAKTGGAKETGAVGGDPAQKELPAKFTGRLLDAATNAPLVGATVWLQRDETRHERVASTTTDAEGAFAFSVPPGKYAVGAIAADHVGPQVAYDLIEAEWMNGPMENDRLPPPKNPLALRPDHFTLVAGENRPVDFPLGAGVEVRGQVVDAAGKPLAGVQVEFFQLGPEDATVEHMFWDAAEFGFAPLKDGKPMRGLISDANGGFRLPAVFKRARITLVASCDGYSRRTLEVAVRDEPMDVVLAMTSGFPVEGTVVDSDGAPVSGASVHFSDPARLPDEQGTIYLPGHEPASDAQGKFGYADIPLGSRLACAIAPGHGYTIMDFSGSNPAMLKIVLPKCDQSITGLVRDKAGNPVRNASVSVYDLMIEDGSIHAHLLFVDNTLGKPPGEKGDITMGFAPPEFETPRTRSSQSGEFKLENLPLGPTRPLILLVTAKGCYDKRVRVERSGWVEIVLEPEK